MDDQIIKDITAEIDNAFTPEGAAEIGMLTIKTANQTVEDAAMRPDPDQLYHELWYEGEVCCLFADSNLGKSIYAVQMADEISQTRNVLYVDSELSDKQFQLRYTNSETGERHIFPDGLLRAEVNPYAIGAQGYEEAIIRDIETAAERTGTKVIIIDNLTYRCTDGKTDEVSKLKNHIAHRYPWGYPATKSQIQSLYEEEYKEFVSTPLGQLYDSHGEDTVSLSVEIAESRCTRKELNEFFRRLLRLETYIELGKSAANEDQPQISIGTNVEHAETVVINNHKGNELCKY